MQLELLAGRGEGEHPIVELLEGGARGQQAQPDGDAGDVRVDGNLAQAEREQEDAGGGLSPDARQCGELLARLRERHRGQVLERNLAGAVSGDLPEDRLDALDLTLEMPPGRIASSTSESGASRTSAHEEKRSRRPR